MPETAPLWFRGNAIQRCEPGFGSLPGIRRELLSQGDFDDPLLSGVAEEGQPTEDEQRHETEQGPHGA
jgi:hypothetical protein